MALRDIHPVRAEPGFVWRGRAPTRIEALSDMVFAFALTLLVVSSAPPLSFSDLQDQLWGFPGFAAAFAMLLLLWHAHYMFFRRYGLDDGWTMALNAAFLFLILFFVYPLKYLATMLSLFVRSLVEGAAAPPMTIENARDGLILFSAGYAAVFLTLAGLYLHALRHSAALDLSPRERALTRLSTVEQAIHVGVAAVVALGAAALPVWWAPFAGFAYFLIGPAVFAAAAAFGAGKA